MYLLRLLVGLQYAVAPWLGRIQSKIHNKWGFSLLIPRLMISCAHQCSKSYFSLQERDELGKASWFVCWLNFNFLSTPRLWHTPGESGGHIWCSLKMQLVRALASWWSQQTAEVAAVCLGNRSTSPMPSEQNQFSMKRCKHNHSHTNFYCKKENIFWWFSLSSTELSIA